MSDPIDRLLVHALHRPTTAGDPCPDADVLGAYVGGHLDANERPILERHLSSCGRCTEHLALLLALEDAEPAAAPTTARKAAWFRWTWAVPALVAVLVAAVWVAVPLPPQPAKLGGGQAVEPAGKPALPHQPPAAPQSLEAPGELGERTLPAPSLKSKPRQSRETTAPQSVSPSAGEEAKRTGARQDEAQVGAAAAAQPNDAFAQEFVPPAPAPPPAAAPADREAASARAEAAPPASPSTAQRVAEADDSSRAARPGGTTLADNEARANMGTVAGFAGNVQAVPIEVPSPAAAVRWRIVPPRIERTTDGGKTWHDDAAPTTRDVRHGVAVSADVCWFATRDGVVLRRGADGAWTTSVVPGHPVVRALSATSPLDAAVTTTDSRVFRTVDGGLTWTAAPQPR